jgi:hypothetical protein
MSYEAQAHVLGVGNLTGRVNLNRSVSAVITGSGTVTALPYRVGEEWGPVADEANTWTDLPVESNVWTDRQVGTNIWLG